MPWTIDLLIDCFSYSRVMKLSINRNCPGKWCQILCSNWNCLDNWFRRLSINWICSDNCLRGLSTNWNFFNDWCLIPSNNWNCPVKRFWKSLYFLELSKQLISDTVHWNWLNNWCLCFQLIGIVQTNDPGHYISIGTVLKLVFTGCLLLELPEQLISGDVHELKLLEQLLGQLLSEIVHYLELCGQSSFGGLCYFENRQLLFCRVQLIDLVSTLHYHAIIASLTWWRSSPYTQIFATYIYTAAWCFY